MFHGTNIKEFTSDSTCKTHLSKTKEKKGLVAKNVDIINTINPTTI